MDDDTASRIDRLETRITEHEALIEDLNGALTKQWTLIDRLTRQVARLTEQMEEAAARAAAPGAAEPPPPHY